MTYIEPPWPYQAIQRDANCSITLTRGQNGKYGWELKIYHPSGREEEALLRILRTDTMLRDSYYPEETQDGVTETLALLGDG